MAEDLYAVLGVPKGADAATIKKAYRKLARDLHPDKHKGSSATETKFKAVNRAYDVLGDDAKRKLYDEFGEEALREGFDAEKARAYRQWQGGGGRAGGARGNPFGGGGGVNLEDLFGGSMPGGSVHFDGDLSELFGGGGRRRGPTKGRDYEQELTIDFTSAVRGTSIQLSRPDQSAPVTVRIPAGASEGSRVRIAGQGGPSPSGGPPGDLLLVIHVTPHPLFERDGDDLHLDVPITVSEAILGAKVKVPTFDGPVSVKVPPGAQSGTKLRIRGKGVARRNKTPGDLYVRLMIRVPPPSEKLDALAAELADLEGGDPRSDLVL